MDQHLKYAPQMVLYDTNLDSFAANFARNLTQNQAQNNVAILLWDFYCVIFYVGYFWLPHLGLVSIQFLLYAPIDLILESNYL